MPSGVVTAPTRSAGWQQDPFFAVLPRWVLREVDGSSKSPFNKREFGRKAPSLLAQIWCHLVVLHFAVVLPWPKPAAMGTGASGYSVNKAVYGVPDLGRTLHVWPLLPLLSLSMVAGLLVMGEIQLQLLGSDMWSPDRMLLGQRSNSWVNSALVWCTVDFKGDDPSALAKFVLFICSKLCLVSSFNCCQFGGCESIALKNRLECGAAIIAAHAGEDPSPLPHFSALPVVVRGVLCRGTEDKFQVWMVVLMLLKSRMMCLALAANPCLEEVLQEARILAFKANCMNWLVFGSQFEFALMFVTCGDFEASALYCYMASMQISGSTIHSIEQDLSKNSSCTSYTCLSMSDDRHVEDDVPQLFGLCHRRWMTTPPLLILRFNSGDTLSLSSVKGIRNLQLNSTPRVYIPDRPSEEPSTGHQLDRTFIEAFDDCKCGNFGSRLSTDGRMPYGSVCDLQHLLHARSTSCCIVQLGTYLSCSTVESHVMMYNDL